MSKKLIVAISSCPNDTFAFDALYHKKIDTKNIDFQFIITDIDDLNQLMFAEKVDVCKVSFASYFQSISKYVLLRSGSALGYHCGPLLVGKDTALFDILPSPTIAIPGMGTTAFFLLKHFYPNFTNFVVMNFSKIEEAVSNKVVDAGLLIHEGRFTYADRGLQLICDLGESWHQSTNFPIPLGGIVAKRNLDPTLLFQISTLIKQSIQYAISNPDNSQNWIKSLAKEMDRQVIQKHIDLYVNQQTISLSQNGEDAIKYMFSTKYEQIYYPLVLPN